MALSFKESRAISGITEILYNFLPGSGRQMWKGHVNFGTVATSVGVGEFWSGGSKKPAINALLSQTLEHRRNHFEKLILAIVHAGILYRQKQNDPINAIEIDDLNGHILEIGFKFPDLWDRDFRNSLHRSTTETARRNVAEAEDKERVRDKEQNRSQALTKLKDWFFDLAADTDRKRAGLTLEKLLNQLFALNDLDPRDPFRVVGEQIDGSFELDSEIYLLESKWEDDPLPEADLLVFRGKIEGKSTFTRGVFIAINDVSEDAKKAITIGKPPSFFIMNGHDLLMILSEAMPLREFLCIRRRLLAEQGRVSVPFGSLPQR